MSETETKPKPPFEISSIEDLRKILVVAKGGDPEAIQAITKFMDFNSPAERSYFPDKTITLCVGQLNGYAQVYKRLLGEKNAFALVADAVTIPFMGYKGFKSNQFVDMTRQTPNLDALKSSPEEVKQGIVSRFFKGGSSE